MTYTFDEAIEKVEQLANFEVGKTTGNIRRDFKLELGDVRDILTELRQEYAPTIEMTKEQYELFSKLAVDEIGDQEELDAFANEELDLGDMTGRDAIAHWLHPETIKVVDE